MTFLHHEIKTLIKQLNRTNFRISPWSMEPSWGSSKRLKMFLQVMKDLIDLKSSGEWNWDFMINLSESDFPIK